MKVSFKDFLKPLIVTGLVVALLAGMLIGYFLPHHKKVIVVQPESSSSTNSEPITLSMPSNSDTATSSFNPLNLNGTGSQATEKVNLPPGGYKLTSTYDGSDNFEIWMLDGTGKELDLIANEVGQTNTSKIVNVSGGDYAFNVEASGGNWTLKIESL